jgi:D-amino peptidase
MRVLIITDLEGCAGVFHRELQVTSATPLEYARTLRICTREVLAAIDSAWAAGATEIVIDALHDIDMEMLPAGVEIVRGKSYCDTMCMERGADAMVLVGLHGGAHIPECALGHTFLPSWQLERSSASPQDWAKQVAPQLGSAPTGEFSTVRNVWLNGRLVGETGLLMAMAAGFGIPTACVCGCVHACEEAQERVPQIHVVPVKWGIHFRGARMLSPAGAQEAIRRGVERALRQLNGIPAWTAASGRQELRVEYVHRERAARAASFPGAVALDEHTVGATVADGRALPGARFLFARVRGPEEGPIAFEAYDSGEWLIE